MQDGQDVLAALLHASARTWRLSDGRGALSRGTAATPDAGAAFRRRFDLMALQRNLKALGTFGYQTTTRGNPVYMQYVPRTLTYVRRTLNRDPRFARLGELLGGLVDELRYNSRPS
ncbi:MAG: hypothetical protein ABL977_04440 [Candidatus Eisenbacteria bacterium]